MKLNEYRRIRLFYPKPKPRFKNDCFEVTFLPNINNHYRFGKMFMYFNDCIGDESDINFIEFKEKCDKISVLIEDDNLSQLIDFIIENGFLAKSINVVNNELHIY